MEHIRIGAISHSAERYRDLLTRLGSKTKDMSLLRAQVDQAGRSNNMWYHIVVQNS